MVGAGIGGLTTALELHRAGIGCRVAESVAAFAPAGVGINILPHAARLLGELGLEAELSRRAVLTRESVFYNRFGQFIYAEPAGRRPAIRTRSTRSTGPTCTRCCSVR